MFLTPGTANVLSNR